MKWIMLPVFLVVVACADPQAATITTEPASSIYWSDGDSGRIDGMKFRLANVDAPETGGVGARGGAKCEAEREIGFDAKAFMVELTRDAELVITSNSGPDRYEREVITLAANGVDVGEAGIEAGHLGPWPHKGRRALAKKPDWCSMLGVTERPTQE
ncbi:MAG: thermonuclease family protein [Hyphomonadaceae bacterium]|nr:thermonuclease family protein [Hyphomonadaceae bacterium]